MHDTSSWMFVCYITWNLLIYSSKTMQTSNLLLVSDQTDFLRTNMKTDIEVDQLPAVILITATVESLRHLVLKKTTNKDNNHKSVFNNKKVVSSLVGVFLESGL